MPVVFVVLILTAVAVTFATSARREVRAAARESAQVERFYAARGALNYALSALAQTSNNGATYGVIPPVADTDANGWMPVGDAWVKIEAVDTAGLINLNTADEATLRRLPTLSDQEDLITAILDWRHSSDQSSASGGASDYYQSLPTPYSAKGAPFDTVEELLLVRGMTPALLYNAPSGNPTSAAPGQAAQANGGAMPGGYEDGTTRQAPQPNGPHQPGLPGSPPNPPGNGPPNPNNPPPSRGNSDFDDIFANSTFPLAELLTTYARERNVASDGSPRVNINTASAQDLQQKLGLPAQLARRLIDYRNGGTGGFGGQPQPGGGPPPSQGNGAPSGPPPGNVPGNGRPGLGGNGNRPGLQMESGGLLGRPRRGVTRQLGLGGGPNSGGNSPPAGNNAGSGGPGSGGNTPGGNGGAPGGNSPGSSSSGGGQSQAFRTIADLLEVRGFTRTVMADIADRITTEDTTYRENVVNINTAPPEVLATVPGMDRALLDAILSYRQGGQAFQSLGDLFQLQNITREQYEAVIGHLCTKSSVYRVHIKVRVPGQPGVYAVSALAELTENGPRVLQWREVPRYPGWSSWTSPPQLPTPTSGGSTEAAPDSDDTGP